MAAVFQHQALQLQDDWENWRARAEQRNESCNCWDKVCWGGGLWCTFPCWYVERSVLQAIFIIHQFLVWLIINCLYIVRFGRAWVVHKNLCSCSLEELKQAFTPLKSLSTYWQCHLFWLSVVELSLRMSPLPPGSAKVLAALVADFIVWWALSSEVRVQTLGR